MGRGGPVLRSWTPPGRKGLPECPAWLHLLRSALCLRWDGAPSVQQFVDQRLALPLGFIQSSRREHLALAAAEGKACHITNGCTCGQTRS